MCTGDGVDSGMGTSNSSKVVSRTAGWEEVLESVSFCKGSSCVVSIHPVLKMPYSGALQAWVGPPMVAVGHQKVGEFLSNIFAACSPLPCSSALVQFAQEGLMIFISHFDILPWHHADFSQEKLNHCTVVFHTCSVDPPSRLRRTELKHGPTQFIFGISSKHQKFQFIL